MPTGEPVTLLWFSLVPHKSSRSKQHSWWEFTENSWWYASNSGWRSPNLTPSSGSEGVVLIWELETIPERTCALLFVVHSSGSSIRTVSPRVSAVTWKAPWPHVSHRTWFSLVIKIPPVASCDGPLPASQVRSPMKLAWKMDERLPWPGFSPFVCKTLSDYCLRYCWGPTTVSAFDGGGQA